MYFPLALKFFSAFSNVLYLLLDISFSKQKLTAALLNEKGTANCLDFGPDAKITSYPAKHITVTKCSEQLTTRNHFTP